jgi:prepilin-type N-terminal cleavage/methylation domain-containing protein
MINFMDFVLRSFNRRHSSRAFTLIELLVVIGVIAILAIVVVLVLNPGQLLAQARDSGRLSDLATMTSALNLLRVDVPSASLGTPSTTYISVLDPTATSSLGDQCQGLGLPASSGVWDCSPSSTVRRVDGTGWVPVTMTSLSFGSPLGAWPQDPVNQTSSGLFYTYQTNGTQYEVTSLLESQKYKAQFASSPAIPNYPEVAAEGSNLTLSQLWNPQGLVGYWPLDEGTGTLAQDMSGSGNTGAWNGSLVNGSHYGGGQLGTAGAFDGSTNYVNIPNALPTTSQITVSVWAKKIGAGSNNPQGVMLYLTGGSSIYLDMCNSIGNGPSFQLSAGTLTLIHGGTCADIGVWTNYVGTYDGVSTRLYVNGTQVATTGDTGTVSIGTIKIGTFTSSFYVNGLIDDIRIYNRALSAAEVLSLYNSQK